MAKSRKKQGKYYWFGWSKNFVSEKRELLSGQIHFELKQCYGNFFLENSKEKLKSTGTEG